VAGKRLRESIRLIKAPLTQLAVQRTIWAEVPSVFSSYFKAPLTQLVVQRTIWAEVPSVFSSYFKAPLTQLVVQRTIWAEVPSVFSSYFKPLEAYLRVYCLFLSFYVFVACRHNSNIWECFILLRIPCDLKDWLFYSKGKYSCLLDFDRRSVNILSEPFEPEGFFSFFWGGRLKTGRTYNSAKLYPIRWIHSRSCKPYNTTTNLVLVPPSDTLAKEKQRKVRLI